MALVGVPGVVMYLFFISAIVIWAWGAQKENCARLERCLTLVAFCIHGAAVYFVFSPFFPMVFPHEDLISQTVRGGTMAIAIPICFAVRNVLFRKSHSSVKE